MQDTAAEQLTLRHARLLEGAAVTVKAGPFRAVTDSGERGQFTEAAFHQVGQ